VGEKPVVAKVDTEQAAQMGAENSDKEAAPAEIAGHEGENRRAMIGGDHDDIGPVEPKRSHAPGQR